MSLEFMIQIVPLDAYLSNKSSLKTLLKGMGIFFFLWGGGEEKKLNPCRLCLIYGLALCAQLAWIWFKQIKVSVIEVKNILTQAKSCSEVLVFNFDQTNKVTLVFLSRTILQYIFMQRIFCSFNIKCSGYQKLEWKENWCCNTLLKKKKK